MQLRRLELILTTRCNSKCLHCQSNASPLGNEVMDVKDAHNYLAETASASNLESFMVFGGEPMLYPERAIAIFTRAHQLGTPRIDMITNGIWGREREKAEKWSEKLKTAGLTQLDISVDAFHLQNIPLEYPRNAAMASVKAGIEQVTWNVTVVESLDAANEYDRETGQILKTLEPVGIEAHIHKIVPVGSAAKNLHHYFQQESLCGPCEGDQVLENPLTEPTSICIEPSGEVAICWSLSIGNAKKTPLSRIISEYDWRKHPVIRTLVEEGPMELLKLPKANRYQLREKQFINKCHLCTEVRKTLNI